jgi:5-methylcytosine-specific restriction endonuclease McrA
MSGNVMHPGFKLYEAKSPPTEEDARSLREFLFSDRVGDELALHALIERHPALIHVLGFSEFASEHPLYKRGPDNEPILLDHRQRDRADFIAARQSIIPPMPGFDFYKSAHIIELKSAATSISTRGYGTRISDEASQAINQLRDYKQWLTTLQENRALFKTLGWDIRIPMLYLVMGRTSEFAANPGHLDELKGRCQELGVCLVTVDELLFEADRLVQERRQPTDVIRWSIAPVKRPRDTSPRILTETEEISILNPTAIQFHRSPVPAMSDYRKYLPYLRRDFWGLCAYCRTHDRAVGGPLTYAVDHFRPTTLFPSFALAYENLYYVCSTCNANKGSRWPSKGEEENGYRFLDPIIDRFDDHFQERDDCIWIPKTRPAEYTMKNLDFNRPHLLEVRRMLRHIVRCT